MLWWKAYLMLASKRKTERIKTDTETENDLIRT